MKIILFVFLFSFLPIFLFGQSFFSEGYSRFYGLKNKKGEVLIAPKFVDMDPSEESFVYHEFEIVKVADKKHYRLSGIIDTNGHEIIPIKYKELYCFRRECFGVKPLFVASNDEGEYGIIDIRDSIVVPFNYDHISPLNYEFSLSEVVKNGKRGIINRKGNVIIPATKYEAIICFQNNMFFVKKNEDWTIVDKNDSVLNDNEYDKVLYGDIVRNKQNKKYGVIGKDGKEAVSSKYDRIINAQHSLNFFCQKENKWGIVNDKGTIISDFIYDSIFDFGDYSGGLFAAVKLNGKWGCINQKGEIGIPVVYDKPVVFFQYPEYTVVSKNGKMGVINAFNEFKIDLFYDEIIPFGYDENDPKSLPWYYDGNYNSKEPHAFVNLNGKWTTIDSKGNQLLPLIYDSLSRDIFKINETYGFLKNYQPIDSVIYDRIDMLDGVINYGVYRVNKNNKWGLTNEKGELLTELIYNRIRTKKRRNKLWIYLDKEKFGYIDNGGLKTLGFIK
jgi:hypothetical protein